MSEEDPLVDGQPLSSLRVVDLREVLDKYGLSKSGNKKELAERLREYLVNGTMEKSPTKSVDLQSPTKSPENSLVAAYKARQAAALNKASEERERVRRESENEASKMETPKKVRPVSEEESPKPQEAENDNNEVQDSTNIVQDSTSPKSEVADKKQTGPMESSNESPIKEASESTEDAKESPRATDDTKEKSVSPSPEKEEVSPKDNEKDSIHMENDNDDHVELDYGDGDADEPTTEEDDKPATPKQKVESISTPQVSKNKRVEAPASDDAAKNASVSSNGKTRTVSPSRYPASEILHIRGLMRPFTIPLLKNEICKSGGEIVDFWIDNIRSHCFVKMRSVNEATVSRNSLHGIHWPISNPKSLVVQFDTEDNMERHKNGEAVAAPVSASRTISVESHDAKTERGDRSERRDRPTLAPLAGRNGLKVTLETMVRDNNKKEEEERERREKEGKEKAKEIEKKMKDRELKMLREKEERENRKRQRSETPPHSRTELKRERRDSPDRKERRRNDSEVKKEEKVEPEKPVKTADEYFKKTVAQPSIYYLPLSEEEANARSAKKERHR